MGLSGIIPGYLWDYAGQGESPLESALISETSTRFLVQLFHGNKYTKTRRSIPTTCTDSKARSMKLAQNQPILPEQSQKKVPRKNKYRARARSDLHTPPRMITARSYPASVKEGHFTCQKRTFRTPSNSRISPFKA